MKKYLAMCGALAVVVWAGCAVMASSALADSAPVGVLSVGPAQDLSGTEPAVPTPARPAGVSIGRPTMSMSAYRAVKAAAGANPGVGKPDAAPTIPSAATAVGFQGITQSQSDGVVPA